MGSYSSYGLNIRTHCSYYTYSLKRMLRILLAKLANLYVTYQALALAA